MNILARPIRVLGLVLWIIASLYWAGGLAQRGGVAAGPVSVAPGAPDAPAVAATPTGAPYPVGDVIFTGHVYKMGEPGLLQPITGANVSVLICDLPARTTTTTTSGAFSLYLAGTDLDTCELVIIDIAAEGYGRVSLALAVADLRADPSRDFSLGEMAGTLFLPIIFRP